MALFSDGPPSSIDDLVLQDSFLLSVAGTEGIDVTAKLQHAFDEVSLELTSIFARQGSIYAPILGQAPLDINHLVVTPALKLWHSFKALEAFYRDAYFSQLNDRYKAKWQEYQSLARWAMGKFIEAGAGISIDPLPRPGPGITSFGSATGAGGTIYFAITFVNATGEESAPSTLAQVSVADGSVLICQAPSWPSNATGWNFYGAASPSDLARQNLSAIALGASWQYLAAAGTGAAGPGTGQAANVTRDLPRRMMRG